MLQGTGEDALDTKARTAPGLRVTSKNRLKNVTLVLKGAVFSCFDDDKLVDIFGDSNNSEADEVPRCHALFNLLDAKIAIPSKHPKLAKPETLRQKSVDILNSAGDVLQFAFQSQSDRVSWGIIMRAIVQSRSRDQSTTTTAEPSKSSTSPQDQTPRIVPGTRKQVNFAIETVSDGSNRQEKKTIVEAPVKSKRQLAIERCGRTARELRCGWIVGDKVEVMFKRYGWTPSIIKTIRLDPSTNTEKIEVQGIGKNVSLLLLFSPFAAEYVTHSVGFHLLFF